MLNGCGAGETLEYSGNSAFVFELLENLKTLAVKRVCGATILLFPRQSSEIGQRTGKTRAITEFPENCKRLFIQFPSAGGVTLIASDIALMIQSPADASAITQMLKRGETLG